MESPIAKTLLLAAAVIMSSLGVLVFWQLFSNAIADSSDSDPLNVVPQIAPGSSDAECVDGLIEPDPEPDTDRAEVIEQRDLCSVPRIELVVNGIDQTKAANCGRLGLSHNSGSTGVEPHCTGTGGLADYCARRGWHYTHKEPAEGEEANPKIWVCKKTAR